MSEVVLQAGERRLATVESLRGVAAVGVMVGHAWGLAHGYGPGAYASFGGRLLYGGGFGVFLFFALTGYLIYWPFARRAFGDGRHIDLRRYALNRALRILPLYLVSVIVVFAFFTDRAGLLRFLLLGENFSRATVASVNPLLWSVVVEVHFYVLAPIIAVVLAIGTKARAAVILGVLGALSLAAWLWKVTPGAGDPLWRYNLPATFWAFVPGMLLALLRLHWPDRAPGRSDLWFAGAVVSAVIVLQDYDWAPLLAVPTFLAVGACVLPLDAGVGLAVLGWRPLALVGVASYSLYIWHMVIQREVQPLGLAIVACFAVAFGSYFVIEAPFLRLRRRWT